MVSPERLAVGAVYPHVSDLRAVSRAIALAVARAARDAGAGRAYRDEQLEEAVDAAIWYPAYVPYEPV
jgi:malic enzyme